MNITQRSKGGDSKEFPPLLRMIRSASSKLMRQEKAIVWKRMICQKSFTLCESGIGIWDDEKRGSFQKTQSLLIHWAYDAQPFPSL